MMTILMTPKFKNDYDNDVITTDMESAGILLLNTTLYDILNHFHLKTNQQGQFCCLWSFLFVQMKGHALFRWEIIKK